MNKQDIMKMRQATAAKYGVAWPTQRTGESDTAYFKRLAKQADQRLVRLEKYVNENPSALAGAYNTAMYDIESIYGSGTTRFNRKLKLNKDGSVNQSNLRMRIAAIEKFIASVTSTPKGIKKVYEARVNTINERYGSSFTSRDLQVIFSGGVAEAIDMSYGSKTKVRSLGFVRRHQFSGIRELNAYVNEMREKHQTLPSEEVIEQARDLFRTSRGRRAIQKMNRG